MQRLWPLLIINKASTRDVAVFRIVVQIKRELSYKKGGSKPSRKAEKLNNYQLLGVTHNASNKEIKNAYYDKSKTLHPDRNDSPDAAIKFQEVTDAYETLSNQDSRAEYDHAHGFGRKAQARDKDDFEFEDPGIPLPSFHFNRNIHSRIRKRQANQINFKSFVQNAAADEDNLFSRMQKDDDFLTKMSPEMREKYEAFVKEEITKRQADADNIQKDLGGALGAILAVGIFVSAVIGGLTILGEATDMWGDQNLAEADRK